MSEPISADARARIMQVERRRSIDTLFEEPWVVLYRYRGEEAWYSALLTSDRVPEALDDSGWDICWSSWRPSVARSLNGEIPTLKYMRFPEEGVEPIVLLRHPDAKPLLIEVAEELRLFLDLFPDPEGNLYRLTETGHEEIVICIDKDEVRILNAPLRQYICARQMHLAIYFDHHAFFPEYKANPLPESDRFVEVKQADRRWFFGASDGSGSVVSRICGKRLLAPEPLLDRRQPQGATIDLEFIIGCDAVGHPIFHSCNPDDLNNYFQKNPGMPQYLTPVHFRRDVLNHYLHDPRRYSVEDGLLRCGSHWSLQIDNDHSDRVIVFLGDLGRDLPAAERYHWRAHNIPPEGTLSKTAWARSFAARPADAQLPEIRFKVAYERLKEAWTAAHGWPLFRPLAPGDSHLLKRVHVPTTDNPAEMDAQILSLAKILIDSINDGALDTALADPVRCERSLAKLERYLTKIGYGEVDRDLKFLRHIQRLRSTGVAHGRGANYEKSLREFEPDRHSAPVIVEKLISGATIMLETLLSFTSESEARSRGSP